MVTSSVIDVRCLLADLELTVRYAMRAGLLRDERHTKAIAEAEEVLLEGRQPDIDKLARMLGDMIELIKPLTLADLQAHRDPFEDANHRRSNVMQLVLTVFAMVVLVNVGYFMSALRTEQDTLANIEKVKDYKPRMLLTELRRMAQMDSVLGQEKAARVLSEKYYQKRSELVRLNALLNYSQAGGEAVADMPMFPLLRHETANEQAGHPGFLADAQAGKPHEAAPLQTVSSGGSGTSGHVGGSSMSPDGGSVMPVVTGPICEEKNGELVLPSTFNYFPAWMKDAIRDSMADFCFQLNAVTQDGRSSLMNELIDLQNVEHKIRDKVALRVAWYLPFLFGLLGAVVLVMQKISDVRTPAMEWHTLIMRVAMGGIAGIIVGWFIAPDAEKISFATMISLPFALAFLAGYGIDSFFRVLGNASGALANLGGGKAASH